MTAQDHLFSAPQVALTNDDWYTPKWIFETMGLEFDLDVAAPPGGISWIPAKRHFTMAEDGLLQPWSGRVWMNPPFSKMTPWADRFREHRNGVAILPLTKNNWSQRMWESDAVMVMLPSNMTFMRGGKPMGIQFCVMLCAFGDENVEAIRKVGHAR